MHMMYSSLICEFLLLIKHIQHYDMTVYHTGDIDMYVIYAYKVTVIVQQYGLPEILLILRRVDAISRDL